jgi:hypothetical protein
VNRPSRSEGEISGASGTGLRRGVNERIRELAGDEEVPTNGSRRYLCECGEQECLETIELTVDEYEEVCDDLTLALVAPGHEGSERVVDRTGRFSVVVSRSPTSSRGEPSAANLEVVLEDLRLRAQEIRHELADQADQVRLRRDGNWPGHDL